MSRVLVSLAFVAALVILVWFIGSTNTGHHDLATLGLGSAFEGSLQLPAEHIREVFDRAREHMLTQNRHGVWMLTSSIIAAVLSFLLTSAITIMVVFRRESARYDRAAKAAKEGGTDVASGVDAKPQPAAADIAASGLSRRMASWIAALAAFASILGGAGNRLLAESQSRFKRAEEIHDEVTRARREVLDAKTAQEAQDTLDKLELTSTR